MYSISDPSHALVKDGLSCAVRRIATAATTTTTAISKEDVVVVRIAWAGICRTDLYAAEGRLPTASPVVLGHEASGVLVESGERVTILPRVRCEVCASCTHGGGPLECDAPKRLGIDRDGVFADYVRLPRSSVVAIPNALSLRLAAYVEPVAAALSVLSVGLKASDRGLIYGRNRIAELTRRVLAATGVDHVTVLSAEEAAAAAAAAAGEGESYDFAIETTATSNTLPTLLRSVRRAGRIILKSRPFEPIPLDVGMAVEKEISISAVRYAPFTTAIDWLATGRIVVDDLLGDDFAIERFEDAFAAARRESNKPFFKLGGG